MCLFGEKPVFDSDCIFFKNTFNANICSFIRVYMQNKLVVPCIFFCMIWVSRRFLSRQLQDWRQDGNKKKTYFSFIWMRCRQNKKWSTAQISRLTSPSQNSASKWSFTWTLECCITTVSNYHTALETHALLELDFFHCLTRPSHSHTPAVL